MSTQHAAKLALFMLLVAGAAQAQAPTTTAHPDTVTINKGTSPNAARVRLVNVGAQVLIMGLVSQVVADTMYVNAPVQIVLPTQPFSISVSSDGEASASLLQNIDEPNRQGRFRNTIYAPFTLTRADTNGKLSVQAKRGKSERVP